MIEDCFFGSMRIRVMAKIVEESSQSVFFDFFRFELFGSNSLEGIQNFSRYMADSNRMSESRIVCPWKYIMGQTKLFNIS